MIITIDLLEVLLWLSIYYGAGWLWIILCNLAVCIRWAEYRRRAVHLFKSKFSNPWFYLGVLGWPWFAIKETPEFYRAFMKGPEYI